MALALRGRSTSRGAQPRTRGLTTMSVMTLVLPGGHAAAQEWQKQKWADTLLPPSVYVPAACTGTQRCPLVVFPQVRPQVAHSTNPVQDTSPAYTMVAWQRALADKYRAILLIHRYDFHPPSQDTLQDTLLQRVLHSYPVDSAKIALVGYRSSETCADFTVFRQVAFLSPNNFPFSPVCAVKDAPPPRAGRVYLDGGLGETYFLPQVMREAPGLRQGGHALTLVLALRGYAARPEDFERLWRWLSEGWQASATMTTPAGTGTAKPATPEAGRALADEEFGPLLTPQAVRQLITFWSRFMQEPDPIRTTARLANQQQIVVPVQGERFTLSMMDTPALAARYRSVRAALKAARLTAQQADAYRRALIIAAANRSLKGMPPPPTPIEATSRLGQNLAFMPANKEALKALGETGMWITP